MISIPTVLVLGAGASQPYGLPLGLTLVSDIINGFAMSGEGLWRLLSRIDTFDRPVREGDIRDFQERLSRSRPPSIDAFLAHQEPAAVNIGKLCIAAVMLNSENRDKTGSPDKTADWYQYLVWEHLMRDATPETFDQNKLSVVTFSYDRSFEWFLDSCVALNWRLRPDQARSLVRNAVPIVHLHGDLGPLDQRGYGTARTESLHDMHVDAVADAAMRIRVAHEGGGTDTFVQAKRLIAEARTVCILGFGYDQTNIANLDLHGTMSVNAKLYGTTMNLRQDQVTLAQERLVRHLEYGNIDALEFLQTYPILR